MRAAFERNGSMMQTQNCFMIFLMLSFKIHEAHCANYFRKWIRWQTTDVTFGTAVVQKGSLSLPMCLRRCEDTLNCVSAHVNKVSLICELSTYYPPHNTLAAVPRTGWTVYYRGLRQVKGIRAWMTSVWSDCSAMNAIDDKIVEDFNYPACICTGSSSENSSWIMEFEFPGTVMMVTPYLRLDPRHVWRNTNFRFLVYNSYNDAMNGVAGTLCTEYTGAVITSLTSFMCGQQPYGRALKLQHFLAKNEAFLQFCEIKVYVV